MEHIYTEQGQDKGGESRVGIQVVNQFLGE